MTSVNPDTEPAAAESPTSAGGYMGFVGVSTGSSSIMQVFPVWATRLGLPTTTLVGHDLPMDATPEQYRDLVEQIQSDPRHRGALVTTHKMGVYAAAADLFSELDPFAVACGEVSSIGKRDGALVGHAKDPITVGLALEEFLAPDHFARTGGGVVILGAGGAGTALSWYLADRPDRPTHVVVVDPDPGRIAHLRAVHAARGTEEFLVTESDTARIPALLSEAGAGALVVNATGLGKDRPGSPLPEDVVFPENAVVWEFNYRGSLEFLAQARAQQESRHLTVVDGWRYFIHGWTQVIAEVFQVPLTTATVAELAADAEFARR